MEGKDEKGGLRKGLMGWLRKGEWAGWAKIG